MPRLTKTTSCYIRTTSCKLVSVQKFSNMWISAKKTKAIAEYYDIGVHEVHELRKRLGLPSRELPKYTFDDTAADGCRYVDRDELTRLFKSCVPIKTIAEEMDIPESSCYNLTKKLGLSRVKPPKGRSQAAIEREEEFRRLYAMGKSFDRIATTLGISVQHCYSMRNELGLSKEKLICSQIDSKTSIERSCCGCTTTMSQSR